MLMFPRVIERDNIIEYTDSCESFYEFLTFSAPYYFNCKLINIFQKGLLGIIKTITYKFQMVKIIDQ